MTAYLNHFFWELVPSHLFEMGEKFSSPRTMTVSSSVSSLVSGVTTMATDNSLVRFASDNMLPTVIVVAGVSTMLGIVGYARSRPTTPNIVETMSPPSVEDIRQARLATLRPRRSTSSSA